MELSHRFKYLVNFLFLICDHREHTLFPGMSLVPSRSPRPRPRSVISRRIRLGSTTPKNSGHHQPREEPWCEAGNQGWSLRSCPALGHNCHIPASGNGFPGTCEVPCTWNPPIGALYFSEDWELSLLGGNWLSVSNMLLL